MTAKRAGKKGPKCCSGVQAAMLSLLLLASIALMHVWKGERGGELGGIISGPSPLSRPALPFVSGHATHSKLERRTADSNAPASTISPASINLQNQPHTAAAQEETQEEHEDRLDDEALPNDEEEYTIDEKMMTGESAKATSKAEDAKASAIGLPKFSFDEGLKSSQGKDTVPVLASEISTTEEAEAATTPRPHVDSPTVETATLDKADGATPEETAPNIGEPPTKMDNCNIFTLWEYPRGAPLYVRLNVESWRRHSYGRCGEPIFINEGNIKKWIPDLPDEYFRLPYQAAKSDVVRYAVIYHHGGLYLDTDFLVVNDLDPVLDVLHTDLVSYSNKHFKPDGTECPTDFSSNFIGGRKGSVFHKAIWEAQKAKMQDYCPASQKGKPSPKTGKEEFCCFKDPQVQCDVPWAGIGEATSHDELNRMRRDGEAFTSHCFAGDDSFVPWEFEGVLQHAPGMSDAVNRFSRFNVRKPLDRIAYHLFNSLTALSSYTCKKLSSTTSLMGNLYRKSFETGHGKQKVTGSLADAFLEQFPQFKEHSQKHEDVVPCRKVNRFESLSSLPPTAGSNSSSSKCKLFAIAYPESEVISLAAKLNLESWRRHSAGVCEEPILVDDKNVRDLIPDLPEEYFRLPGNDEKLDFLRHGLIYHHGGAVLQRDLLFTKNLSPMLSKLEMHDLVATTEPRGDGTACVDALQTAFLGGRRGSSFHGVAWLEAKAALTKHCPLSDKNKEKICCFDDPNINCHVPGGSLGEVFSQNLKKAFEGDEQELKTYCLSGADSFRAPHFQYILDHLTDLKDGSKKFRDEHKKDILDGLAYFVPLSQTKALRCKALFDESKVIGAIYGKSFNIAPGTSKDELPCGLKQSKVMSTIATLPQPAGFEDGKTCNLFSIEVPADSHQLAARMNVETWRRHAAGICNAPVLINDDNVKDWLPDVPDEYFRLPGHNEKLDFIRHGLIYHHGGVVLSREVVFAKSFDSISSMLSQYDLVSSMEYKSGSSTDCGDGIQVFFTGGRKASSYHAAAWAAAKQAVTKHCPESDRPKEILCCFDDPTSQCHIPGGRLAESHSLKAKLALEADDIDLLSHCFSEANSFRPAYFQYVLDHKKQLKDGVEYFKKERDMDLLSRPIFFIPFGDTQDRKSCTSFFENTTVVGSVYSMSFGTNAEAAKCPLPE